MILFQLQRYAVWNDGYIYITPELDSILILAAWDPVIQPRGDHHRKHCFLYCCVLIHCCRDVFNAPLRSNERGIDHRKHRFYCCARSLPLECISESLLSNERFQLSGVMSRYEYYRLSKGNMSEELKLLKEFRFLKLFLNSWKLRHCFVNSMIRARDIRQNTQNMGCHIMYIYIPT
jgi:hypothetical protein